METLILVIVLSTITVLGKRIFPSSKPISLPESVVVDAEQFGAVERVAEPEKEPEKEPDATTPDPSAGSSTAESQPESSGTDTGGTDAPLDQADEPMLTGDLMDDLVMAIGSLPAEEFTAAGKPMVEALEAIVKQDITADQRDKAWALFKEQENANTPTDTADESDD